MRYRNTRSAYGAVSIFFHWISAVIVVGMFASGVWMVGLNYYSPWYQIAPNYHKAFGLILAAMVLGRLTWNALNKKPVSIGNKFEQVVSKLVHIALYVLLVVLFISGYLIATGDGRAVSIFGVIQVPSIVQSKGIEVPAGQVHFYAAWSIAALVVLHAVGALKHHLINKDKVLVRMLGVAQSNSGVIK